jgi:endonuclease V-like protein UPF0215 family
MEKIQLPKGCVLSFFEYRTMDEVQKKKKQPVIVSVTHRQNAAYLTLVGHSSLADTGEKELTCAYKFIIFIHKN